MNKYEIFRGESQQFNLTIENKPEDAVVSIAFLYGFKQIIKEFTTSDGSLAYDSENDYYVCELSSEDTKKMAVATYGIEGKVSSASGVVIRPLGELTLKPNQIWNI